MNTLRRARAAALMLLIVMLAAASAGCSSQEGGAEAQTAADLEALRYVELDPATDAELGTVLSSEGREYLEMFLGKAGEFDYEITGAESSGDQAVVHVRITTYDFASEYLRSWSEFLEKERQDKKSGDDESAAAYNTAELYETLFRNLNNVRSKDYVTDVDVTCTRSGDEGWETDAGTNPALRNAILGGMIDEIAGLADIS